MHWMSNLGIRVLVFMFFNKQTTFYLFISAQVSTMYKYIHKIIWTMSSLAIISFSMNIFEVASVICWLLNLIPTRFCHVIHYPGDKKYPWLIGIGLSQFIIYTFLGLSCWINSLWTRFPSLIESICVELDHRELKLVLFG